MIAPDVHPGEVWWAFDMLILVLSEWERQPQFRYKSMRCLVLNDLDGTFEAGEEYNMDSDDFTHGSAEATRRVM